MAQVGGAVLEHYWDSDDGEFEVYLNKNTITPAALQAMYNVIQKLGDTYHNFEVYTSGVRSVNGSNVEAVYGNKDAVIKFIRELYQNRSTQTTGMDRMKAMRMQQESRKR